MREHEASPIRDVSDTAFMVAAFRALENERPGALFHDALAARLVGERGRAILERSPRALLTGWAVVIRTAIIDEFIERAVADGVDTVLNLGAGLDTRPYRMQLPTSLRWIEVDYPKIIELKERELGGETPRCALERVKLDLGDAALRKSLLAEVDTRAKKALVLTEGVVPYLDTVEAGHLADDLAQTEHFRLWIVDYFSPATARYRRRTAHARFLKNAPFRFQPADWFGFFSERGWVLKEIRYLVHEGKRLGRPVPLPRLAKFWLRLRRIFTPKQARESLQRFAGYALLEPRPRSARSEP